MTVNTPFRTFTNNRGRTFAVRYMPVGARYGAGGKYTYDHPCVEIYDTTNADDSRGGRGEGGDGFGPLGQFVADYRVADLLDRDQSFGLDLYGGEPVWRIDASTMRQVLAWLATLGNTWTDDEVDEFVTAYLRAAGRFGIFHAVADGDYQFKADTREHLSDHAREHLGKRARAAYDQAASDLATWFHPGHAGWHLFKNGLLGQAQMWGGLPTDADDGVVFSAYATRVLRVPDPEAYAEYEHAKHRLSEIAQTWGRINRLAVNPDDGLLHLADITH